MAYEDDVAELRRLAERATRNAPRVHFHVRWIGMRGHAFGYHKKMFPEGVVRRWWFGGLFAKLRIRTATPPAGA